MFKNKLSRQDKEFILLPQIGLSALSYEIIPFIVFSNKNLNLAISLESVDLIYRLFVNSLHAINDGLIYNKKRMFCGSNILRFILFALFMISLLSRNILVSIILYNLTIEATLQIVDRYKYLYKTGAILVFETIKVILTMLALIATVTHSLTNDAISDYFLYLALSNTILLMLQLLIIDRKTLYKRLIKMYGAKRELRSLLTEAIRMKHNLIAGIVNSITKKIIITNI